MKKIQKEKISQARNLIKNWSDDREAQHQALDSLKNEQRAREKLTDAEKSQRAKLNELDGFPTPPADTKVLE